MKTLDSVISTHCCSIFTVKSLHSILVKSFRQAYGVTQTYVLVSAVNPQKPSMHTNSIIRGHRRLNHHQNEDLILLLLLCHGGKTSLPFVFLGAFASGTTLCAPKKPLLSEKSKRPNRIATILQCIKLRIDFRNHV